MEARAPDVIRWLLLRTSHVTLHHTERLDGLGVPVYQIRSGFAAWWVSLWTVTGFAIGGAIFTRAPTSGRHIAHELTHIEQALTVPWFEVKYVTEFLLLWLRQPTQPRRAYRLISFEVEARAKAAEWAALQP